MNDLKQTEWAAVCVTAAIERTFGADVTTEVLRVPRVVRFVVPGYSRTVVTWRMLWEQTTETVAWYVAARMGLRYEEEGL